MAQPREFDIESGKPQGADAASSKAAGFAGMQQNLLRQATISEEDQRALEMKFEDKTIRRGFMRKVYSILSIQLTVTVGVIVFFVFFLPLHYQGQECPSHEPEYSTSQTHSDQPAGSNYRYNPSGFDYSDCNKMAFVRENMWLMWTGLGVTMLVIIPMVCVRKLRVSFPLNFILLAIFTIAESITLGMVSMLYETDAVIIAAGITTAIVFVLTIFAFQTKWDFTMLRGILLCVLFVFLLFGIIMIFVPRTKYTQMAYGGIGALIFSVYLVYDTQMMMGGDHKFSISPEEYIFAAVALYLDILNIFLYLLKIFGKK
eukprot:GFUD01002114.1.p1 GENE.GFUD01002114.1~~GFUD01002114.1.p1  ORF type:complete len:315 (+),score=50.06 GFUD01002114.1:45-989(+)